MNQTWVLLAAVALLSPCSTVLSGNVFVGQKSNFYGGQVINPYAPGGGGGGGSCLIDPYNKSFTIRNLKNYCSYGQLRHIFLNLSPGTFPTGRLRGYTIVGPDALIETVWNGKNFYYTNGDGRSGTVTNTFLGIFQFLRASIYRKIAPIDGKEAFAIDYRNEIFAFLMIDFLRMVQPNLYLGFVSIRGLETIPVGYFLLEGV